MKFLLRQKTLIFSIIILTLFFWYIPFSTQDGPNHKKVAIILSRLAHSPAESAVYQNNLGFTQTKSIFPLLYQPFSKFLSADIYEKIFACFFTIFFLISFYFFLHIWSPQNSRLWVLMLPFCFHPLFMRGMYNYLASVPLTFILLGLLKRGLDSPRSYLPLLFSLFCWAAWISHPFSFFALGLCFFLLLITEKINGKYFSWALYGFIISFFLFIGFIIPLFNSPSGNNVSYIFGTIPILLGGIFFLNFMDYSLAHFFFAVPFFLLLIYLMFLSVKKEPWKSKIFWLSFLASYLIFPRAGSGGAHLNERFLILIWAFLPISLSFLNEKEIKRIQIISITTFLVLACGVFWGMNKVTKYAKEASVVLKSLPDQSRLYPINFNLKGPSLLNWDIAHIWAMYPDEKIVFSPYLFAFDWFESLSKKQGSSVNYFPATEESFPVNISSICKTTSPFKTIDCQKLREQAFQEIFKSSSYYDYWLVHQTPEDFLSYLQSFKGLKMVAQSGDFMLWHYEEAHEFIPPLNQHLP